MATGRQVHRLTGHRHAVSALAFAPDGKVLASGSWDNTVRLWDVAAGRALPQSGEIADRVEFMTVSANGKLLATMGADDVIRLWEPRTGKPAGPAPQDPEQAGGFLALGPTGRLLAFGTAGGRTLIWDLAAGKPRAETILGGPLAFSSDGCVLAGWGGFRDVCVWDVVAGKELPRPRTSPPVPGSFYGPMALSRDGRLLAWGNPPSRWLCLWDVRRGVERRRIKAALSANLAFSGDGKTVAVGGADRRVHLWEVATGQERRALAEQRESVEALALAPDGRLLAVAGTDNLVHLWNVAADREVRALAGHQEPVTALAFADGGRLLVSRSTDGTVLVWDAAALGRGPAARPVKRSSEQLAALWSDLTGEDAAKAFRAGNALAAAPEQGVPLLRRQVRRAVPARPAQVAPLLKDLDNNQYAVRERASRELAALGWSAAPALREATRASSSAEVRRRARDFLERLDAVVTTPDAVRAARVVEMLERIGNAEARAQLKDLAAGYPDAPLTEEARAALDRLRDR